MKKDTQLTLADQLKNSILAKIKAGEVTMKSRTYFTTKVILLVLLIIATCVTSSFLISYIFFSLEVSGRLTLLGFGARGIRTFFDLFPWHLFFLELLFLIMLSFALQHFRFGYRHPALYLIVGGLMMSSLIGFSFSKLAIHEQLLYHYEHGRFPAGTQLYERIRISPERPDIFRGIIVAINNDNFTILTLRGTQAVEVPKNINPEHFLKVGDNVFVAGEVTHGYIRAYGIRKVN